MKRRPLGNLLRWIGRSEGAQDACAPWTHLLSLYADAQTTPQQTQRMEAHLALCARCRASLVLLRATTQVASSWSEMEMPPGLSERLSLAIADEARKQRVAGLDTRRPLRTRFGVPQIAFSGVALAAVVGVGLYVAEHPALSPRGRSLPVVAANIPRVPAPPEIGGTIGNKTTVAVRSALHHRSATDKTMLAALPREARPLTANPFVSPPVRTIHFPQPRATQMASGIVPHPITHPRLGIHESVKTQIAKVLKPAAAAPEGTEPSSLGNGAPPSAATVASAIPEQTPDAPVVRLASTLRSLARSTQHIDPGTDQISVTMARTANYTGAVTMVGSSIH